MILALAALAVFIAQAVRGLTGFGSALVAVPLLTALLGPRDTVPLVVALDAIGGLPLLWSVRRYVDWRVVAALLLPMLAGQWVGSALLAELPEETLRRVVGAVVAVFGVQRLLAVGNGQTEAERVANGWGWLPGATLAGLAGGVLDGLMGTSGPPLVAWLSRQLEVRRVRVQLLGLFSLSSPLLLGLLTWRGVAGLHHVPLVASLIPAMLAGAALGVAGAGRLPAPVIARAVGALLVVAGVGLWF